MGDVYQNAYRVVVWLGPKCDDSSLAMQLLADAGSQVEIDDAIINYWFIPDADGRFTREEGLVCTPEQSLAIRKLVGRAWFERLWVRQEITLAGPTATVVAGHDVILWSHLVRAVVYLNARGRYRGLGEEELRGLESDCSNIRLIARTGRHRGILSLLRLTRRCECSDDRDRVYALLGLIPRDVGLNIQPDYTAELNTVCKSAMLGCMYWVGLGVPSLCDKASSPSWVPDLLDLSDQNRLFSPQTHCIASCRSPASVVALDGERVQLAAVRVGVVSGTSWAMSADWTDVDLKKPLEEITATFLGGTLEGDHPRH